MNTCSYYTIKENNNKHTFLNIFKKVTLLLQKWYNIMNLEGEVMYEELKKIIEESNRIVFFGGAGVSTESNILDFRSDQGLYKAVQTHKYPPEEILSRTFFMTHPEVFYDYYKNNMIYKQAQPNKAHEALAMLERQGKLEAVITQNIDGLHQMAGSKNVFELHGSVHKNHCMKCGKFYNLDAVLELEGVPMCMECEGMIKPDVVLYGEPLEDAIINSAIRAVSNADTLIIGGTSLVVYPAAGLVNYFNGKYLVLINKSETEYDSSTDLVIHAPIGEVLGEVVL